MLNLGLQTGVLLFAKFQLEVDNFLLFPQIRNDRAEFSQLRSFVIDGIAFCRHGRRICSLSNASGLRTDGLKMLVKNRILRGEILTAVYLRLSQVCDVVKGSVVTAHSSQRFPCREHPSAGSSWSRMMPVLPGRSRWQPNCLELGFEHYSADF